MRLGYWHPNTASGMPAAELAVELEQRGWDSLWIPEHSHIPVDRVPVPPFFDALPDSYRHMMDPFVSLASAATVTTRLGLATGVCMPLEHDLLQFALTAVTLDRLSKGRLQLGIGAGWIAEELANHRPDIPFQRRYAALSERITALRSCWEDDVSSFEGTWDRFAPSEIEPKPVQRPLPLGFGGTGPVGMRIAVEQCDAWLPIDIALERQGGVGRSIGEFKARCATAGRARLPVTLCVWGWEPGNPSVERLERYEDVGVERFVVTPPTMARHDRDVTLRRLDEFQRLLDRG